MSSLALNVLVYNGPGIGPNAYVFLLRTLRQFLSHRYAVIPVDGETLRGQPWETKAALLVMPGGRDVPYTRELNGEANRRIRQWVEAGGRFLGICAGGYYGSARCEFEPGTDKQVIGDRELAFFPGTCMGAAYPGYDYKSEFGARAAELTVDHAAFGVIREAWSDDSPKVRTYYNGGGYFAGADGRPGVVVLARYAGDVSDPSDRAKSVADAAAIVSCAVGQGVAVLSGVHPEYAWDWLTPASFTQTHNRQMVALLRAHDAARRRLLGAMFTHMDIDVDPEALRDTPAAGNGVPTPTPIFLVPARETGVAASAMTMYALGKVANQPGTASTAGVADLVLRDHDDIHIVHAMTAAGARRVPAAYEAAVLKSPESLSDTATPSENAADPAAAERTHSILVLCTEDTLPDASETPLFDMRLALRYMRQHPAHTAGSWLMHASVAGSTQTFLEKNSRLQPLIPSGTAFVAAVQTGARGRGRNAWVSPVGCLQFTLLLRHMNRVEAPVVMLQYLYSLAAVDALCGQPGYEGLPLRLKWPNDIYAMMPGETEGAQGEGSYAKIGGLLVGSSYQKGEFTLLFGLGISIANKRPTTCINEVIRAYNIRHGTALAPLSMELALALITARFEQLYRQFLLYGFEPLLQEYYRYWLHTDQVVTLASLGYEKAKVIGLCPREGLLRVRSLLNPSVVHNLQPDGNSFDMMHGLISRKAS
ncbi:biotin holocarboxylase synthetase [Coemansia sp. Benny D115]|nr:biotin holocarboxylase synthetase [Coemansia sp. Benny D115]